MPLELYAHPFSSYCQKVLIALYEKNVAFEWRLLSSENPQNGRALEALWPLGKFPVLASDGRVLAESSIIIEWLDRHAPTPRMIPEGVDAALETRLLDRVFDTYVMTPMQRIVFDRARAEGDRDPIAVAEARALLDKTYAYLDGVVGDRRWAAGDAFGLADCAAAPALFYAGWVHPFAARHARLAAYFERLVECPSFARCIEEARPYRHLFPGGAPE